MVIQALTGDADARAPTERSLLFIELDFPARAPIGWIEFCAENAVECDNRMLEARDVVLTPKCRKTLVRINKWVNASIKPMTDLEHWGQMERWSYPDDGYGDCEDYVLLKRRILLQAGMPQQALLITIVRDHEGEGHAVLTVRTDKGEFILDNRKDEILLWSGTGYLFVKRQAQIHPNMWVGVSRAGPGRFTSTRFGMISFF
jgi:predicted transglutaminase-like cysteine proteinase